MSLDPPSQTLNFLTETARGTGKHIVTKDPGNNLCFCKTLGCHHPSRLHPTHQVCLHSWSRLQVWALSGILQGSGPEFLQNPVSCVGGSHAPHNNVLFLNSSKHKLCTLCSPYDLGRKQPFWAARSRKLAWCLCDRAEPKSATPDFLEARLLASITMEHLNVDRCESQGSAWGIRSCSGLAEQMGKRQVSADAPTHETLHPQLTWRLNSHEMGPFVTPPRPHTLVLHGASEILHPEDFCQPWYLEVPCDSLGISCPWNQKFWHF